MLKAMGTGIGQGYALKDINVDNFSSGKPFVKLSGKLLKDCEDLRLSTHVSLSHSAEYAVAQIILVQS